MVSLFNGSSFEKHIIDIIHPHRLLSLDTKSSIVVLDTERNIEHVLELKDGNNVLSIDCMTAVSSNEVGHSSLLFFLIVILEESFYLL